MALTPDSTLHDAYRITYVADDRPDGIVYRAVDSSGRRVLMAALPQIDAVESDETAVLARQISSLQVSGLLPLLDHFAEERTYYLVCEDPGGQDLERYARERGGPLPEAHVLAQMDRLLRVVETLHDAKPPLHIGDLRSSDVWSNAKSELFLAPFALARPVGAQDLGYRAPELNTPSEEPTTASDMYSFGVLLYQLLTGWLPPNGSQRTAGTPLNAPRSLNPQVSPLAEQATLRSLELKQANRYQVAREMRQALETVQMMGGRSLGLTEPLPGTTPPGYGQPQAQSQPQAQPTPQQTPTYGSVPVPQPPSYGPPQPTPPAPQPQGAPSYGGPQPQQGYAQPAQGYAAAPNWQGAQQYQQPYAQQPPRQRGNTCLIISVILLVIIALVVVAIFVFVLFGPGRVLFSGLVGGGSVPAQVAPTSASGTAGATVAPAPATPVPSNNPAAISISSVRTVTETQSLTEDTPGPVLYSPDGTLLALGLGKNISLRDSSALDKEQTPLTGSQGNINTLAFSPDGSVLASGAIDDTTIRLWNVKQGTAAGTISGHTGWIRSLAFSPDGALLASGSTDTTIKLWDARSGNPVRTLEGHTDFVGRVTFSPDGKLLASTGRDGTVRLWDVATGQPHAGFSFTAPPNTTDARLPANQPYWMTGLAFSPDGTILAAGSTDHNVRIWNVGSGKLQQTLEGHTDWISLNMLAFSSDGKTLASGGLDGTVRLWDPNSGAARGVLSGNKLQLLALTFKPKSNLLATSSDEGGNVTVWNLDSSQVEQQVQIGQGLVTSLAYSNDGAVLGSAGVNGTLRLHVFEQNRDQKLIGSAATSQALAFVNPNELAALSDQGDVLLIDLTHKTQTRSLSGLDAPALSLVVSPDGNTIVAGSTKGTIGVWNAQTGQSSRVLQAGSDAISTLAFSPDSKLLAAGSTADNADVTIFDLSSGAQQKKLAGQGAPITALAFQSHGSLLATASRNGTLRLWNTTSGDQVTSIQAPDGHGWFTSAAFSPDGSVLATGSMGGSVHFWDPATGKLLSTVDGPVAVLSLAFRPDGQQIATSLADGSVRLLGVKG